MRVTMYLATIASALGIYLSGDLAVAQTQSRVELGAENGFAAIQGSITGDACIDHVVAATAGQTLTVSMAIGEYDGTGNAYFNVLPPGSTGEAIHNGSVSGPLITDMALPVDGDYTIRIYQMGSDADLGKTTAYEITVVVK